MCAMTGTAALTVHVTDEAKANLERINGRKIHPGQEIDDFCDLQGSLLQRNPLKKVGGFGPHLFQWVLR